MIHFYLNYLVQQFLMPWVIKWWKCFYCIYYLWSTILENLNLYLYSFRRKSLDKPTLLKSLKHQYPKTENDDIKKNCNNPLQINIRSESFIKISQAVLENSHAQKCIRKKNNYGKTKKQEGLPFAYINHEEWYVCIDLKWHNVNGKLPFS